MSFVFDCSHYQGTINWTQVKADGCLAAYIKTTDGASGSDAAWQTNHANARAVGIPVGPYHFSEDGNAVAEANNFASCWSAGWNLHPVLDEEKSTASAGFVTAFRSAFRASTGQQGFRVYSSLSLLEGALNPSGWLDADTTIWVARYNSTLGWDNPSAVLWQSTSAANIAGVLGNIDEDFFLNGWTPEADMTAPFTSASSYTPPGWPGPVSYDSILTNLFAGAFEGGASTGGESWNSKLDDIKTAIAAVITQVTAISGALATDDTAILAAVAGADSDVKAGIAQLASAIAGVQAGAVNVQALATALVPLLAPADAQALMTAMKTLLDAQAPAPEAAVKPAS
jgi:Glycosyl hydrolases family 25